MKSIQEADQNFSVGTQIDKEDIAFYNVLGEPFEIFGVFYENGKFRRMPEETAKKVSEGVHFLHANTAGGRVRFQTDSPYIAISAKMGYIGKMPHFPLTGSAGFDYYVEEDGVIRHRQTFVPPFEIEDGYECVRNLECRKMREITIHFPLYSEVCELYIGISDSASLIAPKPYRNPKPIVYYGSSITQGGCASRPGNTYQSIISRRFDCDYINLGFSGCALAEDAMADYIKNLAMSAFVYDYDFNAPSFEHLQNTHEKMFTKIREANPDLPIFILSRPSIHMYSWDHEFFKIIKATYDHAIDAGDQNVYLIPGTKLLSLVGTDATVDEIHPNDMGFYSFAGVLGDEMEKYLILK